MNDAEAAERVRTRHTLSCVWDTTSREAILGSNMQNSWYRQAKEKRGRREARGFNQVKGICIKMYEIKSSGQVLAAGMYNELTICSHVTSEQAIHRMSRGDSSDERNNAEKRCLS